MKILRVIVFISFWVGSMAHAVHRSEVHDFEVEVLAEGLRHPWALQFLPGEEMLVSERPGYLSRVKADGTIEDIGGLPPVGAIGQGGLLDIHLHPDFEQNQRLYFCYSGIGADGYGTELATANLRAGRLDSINVLFEADPKSYGGRHFGCRITFDKHERLYLSLGERGNRPNAQDLSSHPGSIVRLEQDGSIPGDNPFVGRNEVLPEIFSYGNRNPQGLARHPDSGEIWSHEHGPQGGDELNIIRSGVNFGWPTTTYGVNYGVGTKIGEGAHKQGMAQPLYYWVPSIAPSGMSFYNGSKFPRWHGNLFIGSLKFGLLVRLELNGERVVHEERLLEGELGRIRDVRSGPDGYLYLLTDEAAGKLVRLVPVDQ